MKKLVLTLFFSAIMLSAADLAGRWTGKVEVAGADNDTPIDLQLKQDGDKLSGTIGSEGADRIELQETKVESDKVWFAVLYKGQMFRFELTANSDQMLGKVKGTNDDGTPVNGKVTLNRAKP